MNTTRIHVAITAALCAASVSACRGWESDQPPVHLIFNMDTQEKGRAYRRDDTGLFADGRVMREPVAGTLAQGQLTGDLLLEEGMADGGVPSIKFPPEIKVDDALRAHGRERYAIYCSPCHGATGDGKGSVALVTDGGLMVPPPAMTDPRLKTMPVGQIYAAIKHGVNNGNMPSYALQIPLMDRWATVAGVRAIQRDADPAQQDEAGTQMVAVATDKPSLELGQQLYTTKGCVACHTTDGTPRVGPSFKGLFGKKEGTSAGEVVVDDAYLKESLLQPMAKIVNGFPPAMPPLPLTDVEVQSLILYIKSF